MPVLTNERHELFCTGVARRRSQTQPYITDGFSCTPSRGAARQPTSCLANRISLNARAQLEKELEDYFAELEAEQAIEKAKAIAASQANGSDDR